MVVAASCPRRPPLRPRELPQPGPAVRNHPVHRPARHRPRLRTRRTPLGRGRRHRTTALVPPPTHPLGDPRRHPPGLHHTRLCRHLLATTEDPALIPAQSKVESHVAHSRQHKEAECSLTRGRWRPERVIRLDGAGMEPFSPWAIPQPLNVVSSDGKTSSRWQLATSIPRRTRAGLIRWDSGRTARCWQRGGITMGNVMSPVGEASRPWPQAGAARSGCSRMAAC